MNEGRGKSTRESAIRYEGRRMECLNLAVVSEGRRAKPGEKRLGGLRYVELMGGVDGVVS